MLNRNTRDKLKSNFNTLRNCLTSVVQNDNTNNRIVIAKGDSGATSHYLRSDHTKFLEKITDHTYGPSVLLPNNDVIQSTSTGRLKLHSDLSSRAQEAHILPQLGTSLISLGKLADDGCIILLDKSTLNVFKNFKLLLTGTRNLRDGLWDIPLLPPNQHHYRRSTQLIHKSNVIIPRNKSPQTLVQYLHAALYSPTKSTLLHAVRNGHFLTWPGLTVSNVVKLLDETPATALGHLDQERQGLQSSKSYVPDNDYFPPQAPQQTNEALAAIISFRQHHKAYFDLIGEFPYPSSRGNKYLLVLYDHDSNAILTHPLKTRQGAEIKRAWMMLHHRLARRGVPPRIYIMDNEASSDLKKAILKYKLTYQLTPPHMHRINAAERAIRTVKNHFLAGLSTVDPTFPVTKWDRLLPQAELTLNLLRSSRVNPKLSAYAYLNGFYDFARCPMAPPGTKIVIHDKPSTRPSWGYHGTLGYYVAPATEHYRCMTCFIPATRSERIADTIQFFPHKIDFPALTLNDHLLNALDKITAILHSKAYQRNNDVLQVDTSTQQAIELITTLLRRSATLPTDTPVVTASSSISKSLSPASSTVAPVPRVEKSQEIPQEIPAVSKIPAALPRVGNPRPSSSPRVPSQQYTVAPPTSRAARCIPHKYQRHMGINPTAFKSLPQFSQAYFLKSINHIYHKDTGKKMTLRALLKDPSTTEIWSQSASNEFGRLMDGNGYGVIGTQAMSMIKPAAIPRDQAITYASMVCDYGPLKHEAYRCRLVVGGDKLPYASDSAAPAANLIESKILFNSVISTKGAKFMTIDISNFFSPLTCRTLNT